MVIPYHRTKSIDKSNRLLAPPTDSILVHQPQFPNSKVSRKTGQVNGE